MDKTEKKIASKQIYNGKVVNFYVDDVLCPTGNKAKREYITHPGGVGILAVKDNKIILERQFRYPFNKEVYEIPAGKLEGSEDHLEAAKRELKEETGYSTDDIQYLGAVYPTVGYSNEIIYLFLAENLIEGETHLDQDELIDIDFYDIDTVNKMIKEGQINDCKTICALHLYNLNKNK